jgi:mannose-6-phosphate isomerase-like protein (cupin superfamily)
MNIDRRELCSLMPALLLSRAFAATGDGFGSMTLPFDQMQARKTNPTAEIRNIVNGKTPTGERVEIHETTLAPGGAPHAAHKHEHSEFWLVREGTIELTINGQKHQLGPGSAGFAASGDLHGVTNPGKTPATYFVVAIGPMPMPAS